MSREIVNIPAYAAILEELKTKIRQAQYKAALSANRELILLYWEIGTTILKQQQKQGWGSKVIDRLSRDLTHGFPGMKGFSSRNLKYMRQFAQFYPDRQIVQAVLAQLTWYHTITLLDKVKDDNERLWYTSQAIQNGWSRNTPSAAWQNPWAFPSTSSPAQFPQSSARHCHQPNSLKRSLKRSKPFPMRDRQWQTM